MTIATFNANSVRARLGIIQEWLERVRPDVLSLQETKVRDEDFPVDLFESLGYQVVFRGQKKYNGVAVATRLSLTHVRRALSDESADEEARFVSCRVGEIPLVNVYVPQGRAVGTEPFDKKLRWLRSLLGHVKETYDPDSPLVITGDFNVARDSRDVYDPEGLEGQVCLHPDERKILERFFDWGLADVLRELEPAGGHYTFWDYRIPNALKRNLGWRIDYILATAPLAATCRRAYIDTDARALEKPSDHTFLVAEFQTGS